MTEDEFWGRGAADMIAREPVPSPVALPGTQAEVDAILAKGKVKLEAPDLLRLHGAHARAVETAFVEGVRVGSQGFADRQMAEEAWRYSRARERLLGEVPGQNVLGRLVVCSDPAAEGHTPWRIVGLHQGRVWLSWGRNAALDIIVPAASCRLITGGALDGE